MNKQIKHMQPIYIIYQFFFYQLRINYIEAKLYSDNTLIYY